MLHRFRPIDLFLHKFPCVKSPRTDPWIACFSRNPGSGSEATHVWLPFNKGILTHQKQLFDRSTVLATAESLPNNPHHPLGAN